MSGFEHVVRYHCFFFLDIICRLCLKRNLKHYVLWTGRSVFDFILSMNDGQSPIRQ